LTQESEGYAKLVTALNRFDKDSITEESVPSEITAIQSLIGYFDLDPNRVLDLLLDWYAHSSPPDLYCFCSTVCWAQADCQVHHLRTAAKLSTTSFGLESLLHQVDRQMTYV
jgi:THO complex subunit 2